MLTHGQIMQNMKGHAKIAFYVCGNTAALCVNVCLCACDDVLNSEEGNEKRMAAEKLKE